MDAVLNKPLNFERSGKKVAEMDGLIASMPFRKVMRTIMETVFWGLSGLEFVPGNDLEVNVLPRKHIKPNLGLLCFEQNGTTGIAYTDLANVWVMGEPEDLGILLKCAPYCLYKRAGMADWAQYVELFGQPVKIIKYDSYDDQTKAELKKILDESGSSLSMMIPKQADFEMKDGKQNNGDGNLQLSFIKAMNEELSITVLGNTETTTSAYSTGYAQSRVHLQQQFEITKSDLVYTAGMLNHPKFLRILEDYGYPVGGGMFAFSKETDIDYLRERIAIDVEINKIVPLNRQYWGETYGISTE